MFNFFKKKEAKAPTKDVCSVADGKLIDITTVPDPTFAEKMMGDGFAVEPANGTICSPIDGEVALVFPTGHAFGVKADDGLEVLVHIGIDTVNLNGKGFEKLVKQGDKVCAGDPCVKINLNTIKEAGYPVTTMVIFTGGFDGTTEGLPYNTDVKAGQSVISRD